MSGQDEPHALARSVRAKQQQLAPDQLNLAPVTDERAARLADAPPRAADTMDEQFPTADITAKSDRDRVMEAKLQLGEGSATGYTPFGKLIARDEDFEWYQKKQAAAEVANFQTWFAKEFDHMSPADKKRAKELYPEFYKQRKRLLKQQTKNLMRLAKLKLEGVEDFDDLKTQYLAETGRLDVGPLQNLMHPETYAGTVGKADMQKKFRRGLLSPFRVFGEEALPLGGESGIGMRMKEGPEFAARKYDPLSFEQGLGTQGFPPMVNSESRNPSMQQDKFWFQMLQGGPT